MTARARGLRAAAVVALGGALLVGGLPVTTAAATTAAATAATGDSGYCTTITDLVAAARVADARAVLDSAPEAVQALDCMATARADVLAAERAAAPADSRAQTWQASWNRAWARWVTPGDAALVPFLVLLLALLLAGRALARWMVGTPRGLPRWLVPAGTLVALALMVAASAGPVLAPPSGAALPARALAGWLALAAAGVVLYALAARRALRIQFRALGADGSPDGARTARLQAEFSGLVSDPPRGLLAVQGTDVTDLPDAALAKLPEGRLAEAAVRLLRALVPLVPWVLELSPAGDDAVVTLRRNGAVVGSQRLSLAGVPLAGDPASTDGDLAARRGRAIDLQAAAYALVLMSERHARLRRGLAGATSWRSVGWQILAADKQLRPLHPALLFDRAWRADPGNLAARLGLLTARIDDAVDANALSALANEASLVAAAVTRHRSAGPAAGWQALEARARYVHAVALANHRAAVWFESQGRHTGQTPELSRAVGTAIDTFRAHRAVLGDLGHRLEPQLALLAEQYQVTLPEGTEPLPPPSSPNTGAVEYARVCMLISQQWSSSPATLALAALTAPLAVVAQDPDLVAAAATDPFFLPLLDDVGFRRALHLPVGLAAETVFAPYADRLAGLGISTRAELAPWLDSDRRWDLKSHLGLSAAQLAHWRDVVRPGWVS